VGPESFIIYCNENTRPLYDISCACWLCERVFVLVNGAIRSSWKKYTWGHICLWSSRLAHRTSDGYVNFYTQDIEEVYEHKVGTVQNILYIYTQLMEEVYICLRSSLGYARMDLLVRFLSACLCFSFFVAAFCTVPSLSEISQLMEEVYIGTYMLVVFALGAMHAWICW
jgi:hypothetical protein